MAYLHNNKDQFQDAIELAYEQTGIMAQAIEKDYYVTMLLRLLYQFTGIRSGMPTQVCCKREQRIITIRYHRSSASYQ